MANTLHNNQTNLQLLEYALNERNKGKWVYINSDSQTFIISNFLSKMIYLLTNWIGLLRGNQKLADVISNSYVELALKADQLLDKKLLQKADYIKNTARILNKTTTFSTRITGKVDTTKLQEVAQKTLKIGLETLSCYKRHQKEYYETLLAIEQIVRSDSSVFSQSKMLTDKQKYDLKKHINQVLAFHPSLRSFLVLLEFPDLAEVNKAKKHYQGSSTDKRGTNGSYVMKNRNGGPCAIFKPDKETVQREDGHPWFDAMEIDPENLSKREEAANLLDKGFSGVPRTRKVTLKDIRLGRSKHYSIATGSLQQWIPNAQTLNRLSKNKLDKIDKEEIHRIAIQDLRWLNTDRHKGNLLIDSNNTLVPIDHGFILPNKVSRLTFSWLIFSQIKEPLSEENQAFILSLDPEEDARELEKLGINQAAIHRMKISTILLKECVKNGLSLQETTHLYMVGDNPFDLYPTRKQKPFFEENLMKQILLEEKDPEMLIQTIIAQYLEKRNACLQNPPPFSSIGWKPGKELGEGINYYHFSNKIDERPQSIHVIKINHDSQNTYQLRVIDHNDESGSSASNQKKSLKNVARSTPNTIALVNGGTFHTSKNDYYWDLGKYNPGDPVGFLKVNGQTAMVNNSSPSQNPNPDFWGFIGVDQEGKVDIHPSNKNNCEELKNRCVDALGAGPVLIESNQIVNLSNKVQSIVSKRGFFQRLFEGKKKGQAPGNIIDHFNKRRPRTCFAKDADGSWYMVVVDYNKELKESGFTCEELAKFMKDLGCTYAINLNEGDSTQMIGRDPEDGKMKNFNHPINSNQKIRSSLAVVRRDG